MGMKIESPALLLDDIFVTLNNLDLGDEIEIRSAIMSDWEIEWFDPFQRESPLEGAAVVLAVRDILAYEETMPTGPWYLRIPLVAIARKNHWLVGGYNSLYGNIDYQVITPDAPADPYIYERAEIAYWFMKHLTETLKHEQDGHVRIRGKRPYFYFAY
jgi:hypothetical protein